MCQLPTLKSPFSKLAFDQLQGPRKWYNNKTKKDLVASKHEKIDKLGTLVECGVALELQRSNGDIETVVMGYDLLKNDLEDAIEAMDRVWGINEMEDKGPL